MNLKDVADKYWRLILISTATLALLIFYKIDTYAGIISNGDAYAPVAIALALLVPSALLYILMLLIEKKNHE